jgi:hypothetical protein
VFSTFADHPDEGRGDVWSLYGLRFESPAGATLKESALYAGGVGLTLARKREEWEAAHWGPAAAALRNLSLQNWLVERYQKKMKEVKGMTVNGGYRNHAAVDFDGSRLKRLSIFDLLPTQFRVRLRAWHCPQSDRIYVCRWVTREKTDSEFEKFCDSVHCH